MDASELSRDSADICGLPVREGSLGRDPIEQIASDFLDELRAGGSADIERVIEKFPQWAAELREFLPLVAAMETWKSQQELQKLRQPLPETFEISRLGDCQILREIARGGMGVVFEAEQDLIGRRVAVKLLPWRFPRQSKWGQQFLSEAQTAANLHHANIVPVFSFGEDQQRFFYVMQMIEGVGLDRLIDRWVTNKGVASLEDLIVISHPDHDESSQKKTKRWLRHDSWPQMGKIAAQITTALRYAHQQGTLHRDIKPANLLIDRNGKVWITDFGLAMARDQAMAGPTESLAGTIRYMAPEQFDGLCDERTDLYAFGVTLYELATLRPPYEAATKEALIDAIRKGRAARPRAVNPDIPAKWESIILKAMSRNPKDRYQNADQLHADLLKFVNSFARPAGRSVWRSLRRWF